MMERISTDSNDGDTKLPTLSTKPKKQPPQPSEKAEKLTIDNVKNHDIKCSTRTDSLKMNTGLLPFPENLMSLLDNGVVTDIIRWLPDGDAFCLKPALFAERVLDKYFQGTKFESFTRKLNRWGFKRVAGQKVPPNTIAYYHKDFIRGKPKLLKNMNGSKAKSASAREKIMHAQLKNDEENNVLMMAASQYQRAKALDETHDFGLKQTDNHLGPVNLMEQDRLRLLSSNSLALEQELQSRNLQLLLGNQPFHNTYLNARQSFALQQQQQRDELQMALLLQQQRGMNALRDSGIGSALVQNHWLNDTTHANMPIGRSGLNALQLSRLYQEPSFTTSVDLSNVGRRLLSQQQQSPGGITNSPLDTNSVNAAIQRLLESSSGATGQRRVVGSSGLNVNDTTASLLMQAQGLGEPRNTPSTASSDSPTTTQTVTGTTSSDQQLLELYLIHQQQQQQKQQGNNS